MRLEEDDTQPEKGRWRGYKRHERNTRTDPNAHSMQTSELSSITSEEFKSSKRQQPTGEQQKHPTGGRISPCKDQEIIQNVASHQGLGPQTQERVAKKRSARASDARWKLIAPKAQRSRSCRVSGVTNGDRQGRALEVDDIRRARSFMESVQCRLHLRHLVSCCTTLASVKVVIEMLRLNPQTQRSCPQAMESRP